jgi:hypothetical protein
MKSDRNSTDVIHDGSRILVLDMKPRTLHFISGRLAAGKTALARKLVAEHHAVFLCEDVWLSKLSDGISNGDFRLDGGFSGWQARIKLEAQHRP